MDFRIDAVRNSLYGTVAHGDSKRSGMRTSETVKMGIISAVLHRHYSNFSGHVIVGVGPSINENVVVRRYIGGLRLVMTRFQILFADEVGVGCSVANLSDRDGTMFVTGSIRVFCLIVAFPSEIGGSCKGVGGIFGRPLAHINVGAVICGIVGLRVHITRGVGVIRAVLGVGQNGI